MKDKEEFVWIEEDERKAKYIWKKLKWFVPFMVFYIIYCIEGSVDKVNPIVVILSLMGGMDFCNDIYWYVIRRGSSSRYRDEYYRYTWRLFFSPIFSVVVYQLLKGFVYLLFKRG